MGKYICKEKKFNKHENEIIGVNISEIEKSKHGRPVRVVYHHLVDNKGHEAVKRSEVSYLDQKWPVPFFDFDLVERNSSFQDRERI